MDTSDGGPGSISVAKVGSPSKWGGCPTGGAANKHAGTASTEVIVVEVRDERKVPSTYRDD